MHVTNSQAVFHKDWMKKCCPHAPVYQPKQ